MPDIVDTETRSRMMAGIRGKDTKPEMAVRRGLHQLGFRYRLHDRRLPGKPDLIFSRFRAVVLVHGCFWHGHDCPLFKWPSSRIDFWRDKIEGNRARDARTSHLLDDAGWRIMTVWECALKGRGCKNESDVVQAVASWLTTGTGNSEIRGAEKWQPPI